ncbi:MAG: ABC transporter permease [Gammaproteobacteria bacterium]|nr:ABC transporter permease [Gammaproteobacteria bacterium]
MTNQDGNYSVQPASLELKAADTGRAAVLSGDWTLRGLAASLERIRAALPRAEERPEVCWDLRQVGSLDTTGALILWRAWGRALPRDCRLPERHRRLFDYWIQQDAGGLLAAPRRPPLRDRVIAHLAAPARDTVDAAAQGLHVIGNLVLDTARVVRRPGEGPWRELSATIYLAGARALPITGLVGIMVGIVVAYLSALQLRSFGADQYIVDMLGFAVIRELGPLIGAIIVAGRSGSSMTAQIGVMRLAQELDAMTALGMSISRRLIWPRVAALIMIMPLLVLWTVLAGLAGGIAASQVTLGLGLEYFLTAMPERVPTANLWIGVGKGVVFGAAVGLTASYFGLRIKPNTRDLGAQTTRAVVVAVTLVILIDAMFAIVLQEVGL